MKITVFTSNQPRHLALLHRLAAIADKVFAIQECATVFPGTTEDFYRKSETMQSYFTQVLRAENALFGRIGFLPGNVHTLSVKMGDLNGLDPEILAPALDADLIVVFGASYIKGALIDRLIERRAINIHMGIAPYYRGSSCNFWALNDGNPDLVGASVHHLSRGLDSGGLLFHALPRREGCEAFMLGMYAVRAAQDALITKITTNEMSALTPVMQDRARELRYTRGRDFTDEVAANFLARKPTPESIAAGLHDHPQRTLVRPVYGG